MKRLNIAFKMFWLGLTKPEVVSNIDMITTLYENIYKVARLNTPMMMRVGSVFTDIEQEHNYKPIVSIWACPSLSGDPTARIEQLNSEISELKDELKKKLNK